MFSSEYDIGFVFQQIIERGKKKLVEFDVLVFAMAAFEGSIWPTFCSLNISGPRVHMQRFILLLDH